MDNNWKRYFHIDSGTSTDEIFVLLDAVQSDTDDDIDELMNDSDKEFIAPAEIKIIEYNTSVLAQEANGHVFDEGITHIKELEINKKWKKPEKNTFIIWKYNVSIERIVFLRGEFFSASAVDIYEQMINLDVLIELLI